MPISTSTSSGSPTVRTVVAYPVARPTSTATHSGGLSHQHSSTNTRVTMV
jgi:hypothetical protein